LNLPMTINIHHREFKAKEDTYQLCLSRRLK
jgi:hypothetical protein